MIGVACGGTPPRRAAARAAQRSFRSSLASPVESPLDGGARPSGPPLADPPDLPLDIQAVLFSLRASPSHIAAISSTLGAQGLTDVAVLRHLSRSAAEQLLPDNVGARLTLLSVVDALRAGTSSGTTNLPSMPVAPTASAPVASTLAAAYESRQLSGLDGRLVPSASILDDLFRSTPHTPVLVSVLEAPLTLFMPESTPGAAAGITPQSILSGSTVVGRDSRPSSRVSFRPGVFFAALLSWGVGALLRSNIPLAAIVGHWSWCARYLDWYSTYSTALYDQTRRSAVAGSVRSGASPDGSELGSADAMLIVDCRAQMDRALRGRSSSQAPSSGRQGKGRGRSQPYAGASTGTSRDGSPINHSATTTTSRRTPTVSKSTVDSRRNGPQ